MTIAPVPLRPRRKILGMSAILLPLTADHQVDWPGFRNHVRRTLDAHLVPAVNMDTGYAHLIDAATREQVLIETSEVCDGSPFVAGAFVGDAPGAAFQWDAYRVALEQITTHGGTPVVFQSHGLTSLGDDELVDAYHAVGDHVGPFLAFELGKMFAPFGRIYSLEVYERLMRIPHCTGAKHSSLSRDLEWERLRLRDEVRPDFHVLTGNDLAIDMVMYGSDYLLGLSTMDPHAFALRDAFWQQGDPRFYELNDWLQYLGMFAFRAPVPAYKHTAAQWMHHRGWIASPETYPHSPERPESDLPILKEIAENLRRFVEEAERR